MFSCNDSLTMPFLARCFGPAYIARDVSKATARKRVLCLDDDPLSLRILQKLLGDSYEVHVCSSVQESARVTREFPTDPFICDYHLGDDMTGTIALQILGGFELFCGCRKILISARPSPEIEADVRAAESTEVFAKPLVKAFKARCKLL